MPNRRLPSNPRPSDVPENLRIEFVEQLLIVDLDAETAAGNVGLPPSLGRALLGNPAIQRMLHQARRLRSSRTNVYADEVLRRWVTLARSTVNDVLEVRRVNCRHCWGIDHEYQFTLNEQRSRQREYDARIADWDVQRQGPQPLFFELGGDGYDRRRDPNSECPECRGDGMVDAIVRDTRSLGPAGLALFDGVKVGKDGSISIKFRNRSHADEMVAKHVGLLVERKPIEVFDPALMTDDQLEAVLVALAERGEIELPPMIEGTVTNLGK